MGLSSIRTAGSVALRIMKSLGFEPELCTHANSPLSSCTHCVDICPVHALTRPVGALRSEAILDFDEELCIECGLCTRVCPTSAFTWLTPTLLELRAKVLLLTQQYPNEPVYITCDQTGYAGKAPTVVSVPCLGMLPATWWISVGSDTDRLTVFLPADLCSSCAATEGETLLLGAIEQAERTLNTCWQLIDDPQDLHFFQEQQRESSYDPARRSFFGDLASLGKKSTSFAMDAMLGAPDAHKPRNLQEKILNQRATERAREDRPLEVDNQVDLGQVLGTSAVVTGEREILLHLLSAHPDLGDCITLDLPTIDDSCIKCGACAYLCPLEAVVLGADKEIYIDPRICTSCELCAEICMPHAIDFATYSASILNDRTARITAPRTAQRYVQVAEERNAEEQEADAYDTEECSAEECRTGEHKAKEHDAPTLHRSDD